MLILKRKTIEGAIKRIEDSIKAEDAAELGDFQKAQTTFVKAYQEKLKEAHAELVKAEADFKTLLKNRVKGEVKEINQKFDALPTSFGGGYLSCAYQSGRNRYGTDHRSVQLNTLKGLLGLMDGPELELTNALAQKMLGKMDILGLLG